MVFDGMHGAGGKFAQRVLVEELGLPEVGLVCYSCFSKVTSRYVVDWAVCELKLVTDLYYLTKTNSI